MVDEARCKPNNFVRSVIRVGSRKLAGRPQKKEKRKDAIGQFSTVVAKMNNGAKREETILW